MITTRRSENGINGYSQGGRQNVALLERDVPKSYNEYIGKNTEDTFVDAEKDKERMRRNLEALFSENRYSETVAEKATVNAPAVEKEAVAESAAEKSETVKLSYNDDITPTATTMQFGDGDVEQMYKEMNSASNEKESYRLNGKGKLFVALYSLAVAVILALIIINTGVLVSLSAKGDQKAEELNSVVREYNELQTKKEAISGDDYIRELVENEYNMVMVNPD